MSEELAYIYFTNGSLVRREKVRITHQMNQKKGKMPDGTPVSKIGNTWFRM